MNISDKYEELQIAEAEYASAKDAASMARREETNALNALNKAQKEFDEACQEIRKAAPGGDWQSKLQR